MRIVITGATGFVGRHVVAAALGRGHQVRAVVRPTSDAGALATLLDPDQGLPIGTTEADLRDRKGLGDLVEGADAVVHLAATKAGDFYTQFAGTVVATENLLRAMSEVGVRNLVAVSTFSVYDVLAMKTGAKLDETAPIDTSPERRDEYAQTKLLQEDLYHQFADDGENRAVIVRPGMIYGRDNLWHALLGADVGPRFVKIGSKATLPLAYVENAAEALVMSAELLGADTSPVAGEVVNLVDDDLPTQASYIEQVSAVIDPPPSIGVPWGVARAAAGTLAKANDLLVGGRAKFPGIVVPDRLHARFKPLRYTNAKAKRLLAWTPRYTLAEAIERSTGDDDLLLTTARAGLPTEPPPKPSPAPEPAPPRPAAPPTQSAPAPSPKPAPAARPKPASAPRPAADPEQAARPGQAPAPRPAADPQPAARPEPAPRPEETTTPRPATDTGAAAAPRPAPESRPAPPPRSAPSPRPAAKPEPEPRPNAAPRPRPAPQPRPRPQPEAGAEAETEAERIERSLIDELLQQPHQTREQPRGPEDQDR